MKEKGNTIIKKISTILSQINSEEHLYKIKNCNNLSDCFLISKKFCEIITNTKTRLIFDISEEFNALTVHNKDENIKIDNKYKNNIHISKVNDDLGAFIKSIKDIVTQTNNKIKNLLLNVNDLSNSLTTISGNLLKMKYSLASSRIDKLFQLKNTMVLNIKSLEILETRLSETLKIDQLLADKTPTNNNINIRFQNNIKNISTSPIHTFSNSEIIQQKSSPYKSEKMNSSNNRDKSIDIGCRNKSTILTNITNACNKVRSRSFIELKTVKKEDENNLKYIESLKKKLLAQRTIIEKLKKEKENLKKKHYSTIPNNSSNKYKIANTSNNLNTNNNNNNKLLLPIICNNNHLLVINEKLNKSSDFIFAITFLINSIQNKNNKISSEPEYENIKMNLLKITTEISELKSYLLKISLENEISNSQNINNKNDSHNNSNNSEMDLLKAEINSLNKKLSDEQCQKDTLQKELNKIIKENFEMKNNNENNVSSLSTKSNNSVILTLKEQLRVSENKLLELKNVYNSDIESKCLIEKLLKKNIEEMKMSYEQKINKLNKKITEKEKEVLLLKDKFDKDISKVKTDLNCKSDLSLENSISLSLLKETEDKDFKKQMENLQNEIKIKNEIVNEDKNLKDKYLTKIKELESDNKNYNNEINELKIINTKLSQEIKDLKNELNSNMNIIKQKDEYLSLKEINSSFANEINSIKNTMNNLNFQGGNLEKKLGSDNLRWKTFSNESGEECILKLKTELKNCENQNKELNNIVNKKDKEIITLITNNNKEKKNLNEQYKIQIERLKNELSDRINMTNQYKEEITALQNKLIILEKTCLNNKNNNNFNKNTFNNNSQKHIIDFTIINNNLKNIIKFKNLIIKKITELTINEKDKNNDDDLEYEDEEYDDFDDDDDEDVDEEYINRMKKLNKNKKGDKDDVKLLKKENRKMILRLEDAVEESNELKKKMIIIEGVVVNKENELYNSLKKSFIVIFPDFNLNNKNKENLIYFLKLLQYSENEINQFIKNKK